MENRQDHAHTNHGVPRMDRTPTRPWVGLECLSQNETTFNIQVLTPFLRKETHERVYISDLPAFGIKQQDSIGRSFKESPVASFGCVQIAFGLPSRGNEPKAISYQLEIYFSCR